MKPNMGWFERILRVVVGGLLISSAAIDQPFMTEGWLVWVSGLVGLVLVVTGLTGYCWLYAYLDNMVEEERSGKKSAGTKKRRTRRRSTRKNK